MESRNKDMENSTIPHFFKNNRIKMGGEENNKSIATNNENTNDISNNVEKSKETMQFLFPKLPPEEINSILERSEYNIEKAIILFKEIKGQKNKLSEDPKNKENLNNPKHLKVIKKRNHNSIIQKESSKNENKVNIITNNNIQRKNIEANILNNNISLNNNNQINIINTNNINNSSNSNELQNNINKQENSINPVHENNSNSNINSAGKNDDNSTNNNNISLDEDKKNLINRQINYLIGQFVNMTDISQLKKLLKEIGFPENKENKKEDIDKKLVEMLKEKIESNHEERKFIINQYNKHQNICEQIKKKEEKIDELTSSLGNLIDAESQQKMREEEYRNELMEYLKSLKNDNSFNNPREGY